jgi:hypothetical protein
MPLRDHFHRPLSTYRHWEGLHSRWTASILDHLDEQLPPRYYAEPQVHSGTAYEIDVATFEDQAGAGESGPIATAVTAIARPMLTVSLPTGVFDTFEVRIFNDEAGPRLVGAIELVSPGNKDRPLARRAFAIKCCAYLQQGVSVMVVDTVTSRTANVHREIMDLLGLAPDVSGAGSALLGAAYRTLRGEQDARLEVWLEPLAIGGPLPTLPLWLDAYEHVAVDLEQTYEAACRKLRIA